LTAQIIVFAKAPQPGEVKTRLIPALGAAGAARLHVRLVERALATAAAAAIGPMELCCAPDAPDPLFAALARAHGAALAPQGPGDLGDRMHAAFARTLTRARAAILIGCDCPALTPQHLREAGGALDAGYDAALAPAEDGGYVLIGLRRADPEVFARIRWGGPDVLAETRLRLASLGCRWRELDPLWDVDRPADLPRLRAELPDGERLLAGLEQR
jgi:uncharacterized protein